MEIELQEKKSSPSLNHISEQVVLQLDRNIADESSAIHVQNVNLSFGSNHVLHDLSMDLPRGSIYGLLGPSGCGKTSLIRCILGSVHFNSGSVAVFGERPGSAHSSVPGTGVGYMPQDISLYAILSISETLQYFGSLYGMTRSKLKAQIDFLVNLLDLPDRSRRVGILSGGQKRRVSLATALIHDPPLLILDEPTVGVDPLLRRSIWHHLTTLSTNTRLTVLITTHYIEEARDANLVGLMRNGRILEQDSPLSLLARFRLNTLEQVFLHICTNEEEGRKKAIEPGHEEQQMSKAVSTQHRKESTSSNSSGVESNSGLEEIPAEETSPTLSPTPTPPLPSPAVAKKDTSPSCMPLSFDLVNPFWQMFAMCRKNFRTLRRSPGYMLFQFLLPTLEVALFCLCIGLKLHSIPVAVYDGDQSELSVRFLRSLSPYVIEQHRYNSEAEAIEAVRNGEAASALAMYANFSDCLHDRLIFLGDVSNDVLRNSTIHLHPDMSNQLMAATVHQETLRTFIEVGKNYIMNELGASPNLMELPVRVEHPVYGNPDPPFREFMVPGVILSITFLAAIPLTTMNLVVERKDGMVERTVVAGVSHFWILLSHLLSQTLILLVQVLLLMAVVFPVFKISYHGEFLPILLLTFSQSFCGLSFGLLVSAVSDTENTATMLSLGAFYPMLLLSGTVWPIEAMSPYLHAFAKMLPQTIPILSMRDMIARGWHISSWGVARGFLVSYLWVILFLLIATLIFRRHK